MHRPRRAPLVSLLGPSGSGKTTLAVALLEHWSMKGLAVGYLKHASHGFDMDRPGKDSFRANAAGALGVAVVGPEGLAYLRSGPVPEDPRALAARFFPHADVVLLEGFREAVLPSVALVGDEGTRSLAEVRGPLLAIVADVPPEEAGDGPLPLFARSDVAGLAAWLERCAGIQRVLQEPEAAAREPIASALG